jgi:nucleoside-diphosphate-sugar epimerase
MSPYGITKLASTLYARSVAVADERPIVVLRLFSVYGPFENPRRFVSRVVADSVAAAPLRLSRPDTVRDWVYVSDVVELLVEAALKARALAGGVFNAGSGVGADLRTIVDTIQRLTGSQAEQCWGTFPAPAHDDYPWVADPRRTFNTFAWRPTTTLEEGLQATIDFARIRVS